MSWRAKALGGSLAALFLAGAAAADNADRYEAEEVSTPRATGDPFCEGPSPRIHVTVDNINKRDGQIVADLHDDVPEHFLKKGNKLARVRVPADAAYVQFCFSGLEPGTYGVGIYHDVNGNRDFDKNFIGLPAEPWGLSTNPGFKPRAPQLDDADFEAGPGQTAITISLKK